MRAVRLLVAVLALAIGCQAGAIPIWELLTYQEKMGRVLYILVHLVERYCEENRIPDCRKVVTLHGASNLLSEHESYLDLLDPYQRDSNRIIWRAAMRTKYLYPEQSDTTQDLSELVEQDAAVTSRVLPPPHFRVH